jgi:hypothetical protein
VVEPSPGSKGWNRRASGSALMPMPVAPALLRPGPVPQSAGLGDRRGEPERARMLPKRPAAGLPRSRAHPAGPAPAPRPAGCGSRGSFWPGPRCSHTPAARPLGGPRSARRCVRPPGPRGGCGGRSARPPSPCTRSCRCACPPCAAAGHRASARTACPAPAPTSSGRRWRAGASRCGSAAARRRGSARSRPGKCGRSSDTITASSTSGGVRHSNCSCAASRGRSRWQARQGGGQVAATATSPRRALVMADSREPT